MSTETHDLQHFQAHVKVAIGVFIALLVLTVVTVTVAQFHFGHFGNIVVALVIAVVKASLVAAYFMHLNAEKGTIYKILWVTGFFVAGLVFLTLSAYGDDLDIKNGKGGNAAHSYNVP